MGISSSLGSSALLPAGLGFRNMVTNGNFAIDQRNAGAAQSGQTTDFYAVDRFVCSVNASGNFTGQQVALSTLSGTQPAGFTYALGCTAASGRTAAAGDVYGLRHRIEGFNSAQLSWGTANAKPAMLSFWVRSSVTGTYNVGFFNASANRSFVTSYTINTANTWEYETILIPGDTSGTWGIGNGVGVEIFWDLGTGSTYNASTLNTWTAGIFVTSAASIKWIATASATFYITGVQLEQNYQPTPFEQRPIGVELALCQRYYEKSYADATAPGTSTFTRLVTMTGSAGSATTGEIIGNYYWAAVKRVAPTVAWYDHSGNSNRVTRLQYGVANHANNVASAGTVTERMAVVSSASGNTGQSLQFHFVADVEL